jgi:hypothetical protein
VKKWLKNPLCFCAIIADTKQCDGWAVAPLAKSGTALKSFVLKRGKSNPAKVLRLALSLFQSLKLTLPSAFVIVLAYLSLTEFWAAE